ncbi:MAG: hypothetical protein NW226_06570 [Microscillaceae bacterium]|nr:hypothetical protein [Microscillaceae bacterium]
MDEVFSYVYFVSPGVLVAVSYYPGPNNHILFNLLGALFNHFGGFLWEEPVWGMRLLSVWASLGCSLIFFYWVYRLYNFKIAWWACLILNLQIPFFTYSILGRGYMLQLFFLLLTMPLGLKLLAARQSTPSANIIYVLGASLGFYCIPTFLYPYFALTAFLFFWSFIDFNLLVFKRLLILNLQVIGLTILLYSPVIWLNGWKALSNNSWVASLSWTDFWAGIPAYFEEISRFFWDDAGMVVGGLFIGLLGIYIFSVAQHKKIETRAAQSQVLMLFLIFAPALPIFMQRVLPFPRVWMYLSIPISFIVIELGTYFFNKKENLILGGFSFIQILILVKVLWIDYQTPVFQELALKILAEQPKQLFVNEDTYLTFIQYEAFKKKQKFDIETHNFQPTKAYSWIIVYKGWVFPQETNLSSYHLFKEDDLVKIYQNKLP